MQMLKGDSMVSASRFVRFAFFASIGLFLFGCSGAETPLADEATGDKPLAEPPLTVVQAAATDSPSTVAAVAGLSGADFLNGVFDKSFLISPTVLSLKHYGSVTATAKVAHQVSEIRLVLQGRPAGEVYPKVNVSVEQAGRRTDVLRAHVVEDKFDASMPVEIGPGEIKVAIEHLGDTSIPQRPALDVHKVEFK